MLARHLIQDEFEVVMNPRRISLFLTKIVALVVVGHIVANLIEPLFAPGSIAYAGIYNFFNMGAESNFPTFVSTLNLLFAGLLCAFIAQSRTIRRGRQRYYWWGMALGLMLMGFDEAAMIHEGLVGQILESFTGQGEGIFYYVWYTLYIPIVLVVGGLYVPFLRRLPLQYSLLFVLSGIVYFGGALGMEMLESYLAYNGYAIGVNIIFEETFEMMGIVILIYALLLYLANLGCTAKLRFTLASGDSALPED